MYELYKSKVALLIDVLSIVKNYEVFALHGGTAINLFIRDKPRLSVDIDLTYVPLEDREDSLSNIDKALIAIKADIEATYKSVSATHKQHERKLIITKQGTDIKLEINTTIRGTISDPVKMPLCEKAQDEFKAFTDIHIVPIGQVYGGKIIAALDRQHPRDLFDIKYLLENEGITDEIKKGMIFSMVSSARPIIELLNPNLKNQKKAMQNQFEGMSREPFDYDAHEKTRDELIKSVNKSLDEKDKAFLLSLVKLEPNWRIYDFKDFPSVMWKIQNLETLQKTNKAKYEKLIKDLKEYLKSNGS